MKGPLARNNTLEDMVENMNLVTFILFNRPHIRNCVHWVLFPFFNHNHGTISCRQVRGSYWFFALEAFHVVQHLSLVHRWPVRLNSHQAESLLHANSEHNTKIPKTRCGDIRIFFPVIFTFPCVHSCWSAGWWACLGSSWEVQTLLAGKTFCLFLLLIKWPP